MKYRRIYMLVFAALTSCANADDATFPRSQRTPVSFSLQDNYRAWQGVAIDSQYVYIFTDRNESFEFENIISVYSHFGQNIREYRGAYTGTDSQGNFMSFGDGNVLDGKLYITAYNFNTGARLLQSRILVWSIPDLRLVSEHDIGGGVAESVTKHNHSYWVTYHDKMEIRRFNAELNLLGSYFLSQPKGEYGGYQGAYWDGDDLLLQMHGPNEHGLQRAKGLDRYRFDGNRFVFLGTEQPLGYGTGQGIAVLGDILLQNDRPNNSIVVKRLN